VIQVFAFQQVIDVELDSRPGTETNRVTYLRNRWPKPCRLPVIRHGRQDLELGIPCPGYSYWHGSSLLEHRTYFKLETQFKYSGRPNQSRVSELAESVTGIVTLMP
jgi:hypothetical protein